MIKSILKPKKKLKLSTLRNKCDKKMQETGRKVYSKCLVCGMPMSCLHHVFTKSRSSALRYDWENLIPDTLSDILIVYLVWQPDNSIGTDHEFTQQNFIGEPLFSFDLSPFNL